ncbi:M1 family aminopeptidase [Putridiphycobacter roseus]|nr:M1 family aminopeptidase [Putridiphycobacter roseus]
MKIIRLLFLLLVMNTKGFGQTGSHLCAETKSKRVSLTQSRSNTLNLAQIATTELYDVHFYLLDLNVERTTTDLFGAAEMHAKVLAPTLTGILFELHEDLAIDSIYLDNVNVSNFNRTGSAVTVPANFVQNDFFKVRIVYGGSPPNQATNPLAGGGINNASSGSWGNQVTWTLSEPFSAYEWWPCKQSLTDKADSVHVSITTDSTNKAGSIGLLKNVVDLGNGKHRYNWESVYPIDYYLISITVAAYVDYSIYANPVGATAPILVQNYIYDNPLTLGYFQNEIDHTVDFIEYFSTLFGLYPFHAEKYGHCMAPFNGGMEHQTMTTQGFFEDGLTAHELGHQWFGDNVTCATWADIWLNEGFASYTEYLMEAKFNPGDEVGLMEDVHNNVMSQTNGSVWVEDSLNTNRIFSSRLTYDKGNAIVHTLRFLMDNDTVFFNVLKTYQTQFAGGTARLNDFKNIAENLSGLDLTAFFNEWYYGHGYPTYSVKYHFNGVETILEISHTASSINNTPLFTNDIEVKCFGVNGSIGTYRIPITANTVNTSVPFSHEISSVVVDPDNWIINKTGSIQEDINLLSVSAVDVNPFNLFPNPAKDVVYINGTIGDVVTVYSVSGQLLFSQKITNTKQAIDISSLSKGLYMVKVNEHAQQLIVV